MKTLAYILFGLMALVGVGAGIKFFWVRQQAHEIQLANIQTMERGSQEIERLISLGELHPDFLRPSIPRINEIAGYLEKGPVGIAEVRPAIEQIIKAHRSALKRNRNSIWADQMEKALTRLEKIN